MRDRRYHFKRKQPHEQDNGLKCHRAQAGMAIVAGLTLLAFVKGFCLGKLYSELRKD